MIDFPEFFIRKLENRQFIHGKLINMTYIYEIL